MDGFARPEPVTLPRWRLECGRRSIAALAGALSARDDPPAAPPDSPMVAELRGIAIDVFVHSQESRPCRSGRIAGGGWRPDPPDRAHAFALDWAGVPHGQDSEPIATNQVCGHSTIRPFRPRLRWVRPALLAAAWARVSCCFYPNPTSPATSQSTSARPAQRAWCSKPCIYPWRCGPNSRRGSRSPAGHTIRRHRHFHSWISHGARISRPLVCR